jgi:hypothetical protein
MWNQGNWQVFSAGPPPAHSQREERSPSRKYLPHFF